MRLVYYLLYAHIDDEEIVAYLFQEELKDRTSNSFQGIGNTLHILTYLLSAYNSKGKYDEMFQQAKNANFDCACGYDKDYHIDDEFEALDLMDCIYLSQELEYKDVMEALVSHWEENIVEWTDGNRKSLVQFNSFLGKEEDNEQIYKTLLEECFEIICGANAFFELWVWAKPYLQKKRNMYGNLYTKGIAAAKATNDSYEIQLEQEYQEWKGKMGLR